MYEDPIASADDKRVAGSALGFRHGSFEGKKQREHFTQDGEEGEGHDGGQKEEDDETLSEVGKYYNDDEHDGHGIDAQLLQEMIQATDLNSCSRLLSLEWDDPTAAYEMTRVFDAAHDEFGVFGGSPSVLPNTLFPPMPAVLDHLVLQPSQSVPLGLFPSTGTAHDPAFDVNAQAGPHCPPALALMRDLFHSLPLSGSALFGGGGEQDFASEGRENGLVPVQNEGASELGREGNGSKQQPHVERERRSHMKDKFNDLKMLNPSSTKSDRASIVGETIEYIKELKSTVDELKLLVEKKRCGMGSRDSKRQRIDQDHGDMDSCITNKLPTGEPNASYCNGLRSSLLRRKSNATEVDVRIIDDEVTVKLVQRKKNNCLLRVSGVFDELQLDLQHVAGGELGDHYSFLFNSKIHEGSSVFASAIASKLIEALEGRCCTDQHDH